MVRVQLCNYSYHILVYTMLSDDKCALFGIHKLLVTLSLSTVRVKR